MEIIVTLVIADSSNLILISKLELLDIFLEIYNEIIIPQAVYKESVEQGKEIKKIDAFFIEKRIREGKINVEKIKNIAGKNELIDNFNLHEGEAEAIILFFEKKADLLGTDDYRTIKTCKILKIRYYTTLSFIYLCFKDGKLSKEIVLLKLENLETIGWYKRNLILYFKEKIKKEEE